MFYSEWYHSEFRYITQLEVLSLQNVDTCLHIFIYCFLGELKSSFHWRDTHEIRSVSEQQDTSSSAVSGVSDVDAFSFAQVSY